jgi:BlaI family transcriptional regulator, penicillinase repressor
MRKQSSQLTPLELQIMEVLWEIGPASVQGVQQKLDRDYAHTTVHTMLNVLVRKGKVKRTPKERAHVYRAAVTRSQVVSQTVKDVVDKLFRGSAAELMMNVIETRDLTTDDVAQLRKKLEELSHDPE